MNQIWIELRKHDVEFNKEQCILVNNMLARLARPEHLPLREQFFWSEHDRCYCYGGDTGYVTLTDNGTWLNLDYMAGATR